MNFKFIRNSCVNYVSVVTVWRKINKFKFTSNVNVFRILFFHILYGVTNGCRTLADSINELLLFLWFVYYGI